MVTKEEILNLFQKNALNTNDMYSIIESYCLEMGKKQDETTIFLNALLHMPFINVNSYLDYALRYYERKYGILSLIINGKKIFFKQEI